MFDSNRMLHTIADHLLQLLPAEPASFKRLDDIGEAEPSNSEDPRSDYPESGVPATTTTVRAVS